MTEEAKGERLQSQGLQITRGSRAAGWKFPLGRDELRLVVRSMLAQAGLDASPLEIALLDDHDMAKVHHNFLGCDTPTNVLAFPSAQGCGETGAMGNCANAANPKELGWMAVSSETLIRECFLYGQEPSLYTIRLLAHGIAHLAGYSHGQEMDEFSDKLCARAEKLLADGRRACPDAS